MQQVVERLFTQAELELETGDIVFRCRDPSPITKLAESWIVLSIVRLNEMIARDAHTALSLPSATWMTDVSQFQAMWSYTGVVYDVGTMTTTMEKRVDLVKSPSGATVGLRGAWAPTLLADWWQRDDEIGVIPMRVFAGYVQLVPCSRKALADNDPNFIAIGQLLHYSPKRHLVVRC